MDEVLANAPPRDDQMMRYPVAQKEEGAERRVRVLPWVEALGTIESRMVDACDDEQERFRESMLFPELFKRRVGPRQDGGANGERGG